MNTLAPAYQQIVNYCSCLFQSQKRCESAGLSLCQATTVVEDGLYRLEDMIMNLGPKDSIDLELLGTMRLWQTQWINDNCYPPLEETTRYETGCSKLRYDFDGFAYNNPRSIMWKASQFSNLKTINFELDEQYLEGWAETSQKVAACLNQPTRENGTYNYFPKAEETTRAKYRRYYYMGELDHLLSYLVIRIISELVKRKQVGISEKTKPIQQVVFTKNYDEGLVLVSKDILAIP